MIDSRIGQLNTQDKHREYYAHLGPSRVYVEGTLEQITQLLKQLDATDKVYAVTIQTHNDTTTLYIEAASHTKAISKARVWHRIEHAPHPAPAKYTARLSDSVADSLDHI